MKKALLFSILLSFPLFGQVIPLKNEDLPFRVEENLYEPYYEYSTEQIKEIKSIPTEFIVTKKSLEKWDALLADYINTLPFSIGQAVQVLTYLYTAQADFSYISQEIHGEIKGSLDPVSLETIRLFFPLFPAPKDLAADEFSIILARMVVEKYKKRLKREESSEKEMADYFSLHQWGENEPVVGKNILGWLPWVMPPFSLKFMPAPPPLTNQSFWSLQLEEALHAYQNATEEQKKFAKHWDSFFQREGNWLKTANDYLLSHPVDLDKILYVREYLSFAIYDAMITAFQAKYTYLIPPPYLKNKKIVPIVEFYNYPSYPSVNAMVSFVSAYLLGHFFPDKKQEWFELAEKISESRIWAGVNYPIDIEIAEKGAKIMYRRILLEWQ